MQAKVTKQPNGRWRATIGNPATDVNYFVAYAESRDRARFDVERKAKKARGQSVIVDIRKAFSEPGYLLSVERKNNSGGSVILPGPKCSNLKTAITVANWIENNLQGAE